MDKDADKSLNLSDDSDISQDEWEPECKQAKMDNQCIIHCSNKPGKIAKVESLKQWNDLVDAAKKLDYTDILDISTKLAAGTIPKNVCYHTKYCSCL